MKLCGTLFFIQIAYSFNHNRYFFSLNYVPYGLSGGTAVKNAANARNTGDAGLIPGSGRYPEVRNETRSSILEWKICEQRNLEGYSP